MTWCAWLLIVYAIPSSAMAALTWRATAGMDSSWWKRSLESSILGIGWPYFLLRFGVQGILEDLW